MTLEFTSGRSSPSRRTMPSPTDAAPAPGMYAVEELWYLLLRRRWSCLAVVSPDRTPNTLRLARSLAAFGTQHRRRPVEVIDALELDIERASTLAHSIEVEAGSPRLESRFVVALDSPLANPSAIEVLTACDAAVLLLEKGITRIPQARKIIDIAGRHRLVGAVLAVE
jgi:hypothetical protein